MIKINLVKGTFNKSRKAVLMDMIQRGNCEDFNHHPKDTLIIGQVQFIENGIGEWLELEIFGVKNYSTYFVFATGKSVSRLIYRQFDFNKCQQYIDKPNSYWLDTLTKRQLLLRWWKTYWK